MKQTLSFTLSFCFSFFLFFQQAQALGGGGWDSSGGELFRYAHNPWFLKNITDVPYCILVDQESFSFPEADVNPTITKALQYWKHQFLDNHKQKAQGFAQIGTQNWIFHSHCDGTELITFKMGYGTLTVEEREYLKAPQKYVGVTVRKEYKMDKDTPLPEFMVGKGFIYISSDKGPHSYDNPGHLVTEAWQIPNLLEYALIHELGHVFGIPHTGVGVMSEVFLDQLLHKKFSKYYSKNSIESFIQPPDEFKVCLLNGSFDSVVFKTPLRTACLLFKSAPGEKKWKVTAWHGPKADRQYTDLGWLIVTSSSSKELNAKAVSVVNLPPHQTLFSQKERLFNNFLLGPLKRNFSGEAFYRGLDSRKPLAHFKVELTPESVTLYHAQDNKVSTALEYTPASLLKKLFDIEVDI